MKILLCNDDGYQSLGLDYLRRKLSPEHDVYVSAPKTEMSGVSSSITLRSEIDIERIDERVQAVGGTPIDSAKLGLLAYLDEGIDLVLSGINLGTNLGTDTLYSGTVAAALDASLMGYKSAALSTHYKFDEGDPSEEFNAYFKKAIEIIMATDLPEGTILNINIPPKDIKGIKIAPLAILKYNANYTKNDETKDRYQLVGGRDMTFNIHNEVDERYYNEGYMTVTAVHYDMTNYNILQELKKYE